MKKVSGFYLSLAATTVLVIAGCATSHFHSSRKPADENFEQLKGNYDKIFPLYAIECASSKYDAKGQAAGGPYGHTFMYLKGACRDKSVDHPQIKVCDPGTDLSNPESGVGLALDKSFENTRYIATDGFNFLINGDLTDNASLDTDEFEAAVRKMVADGDAKGVVLHPSEMAAKKDPKINKGDPNMSDEEWVAREIIGSSFAVDFARNLGCVTVPINAAMLQSAVDYVNKQNQPFISGKKKFVWNPVTDQCVQFTHNILAAMGIGKHITTTSDHNWLVGKFFVIWDVASELLPFVHSQMPAPVNDLVATETDTNGSKIYTVGDAYKNKAIRSNFRAFNRLAATDGVLMWTQAAVQNGKNQYFDTQSKLKALDIPVLMPETREYRRLTEMPKTTEIADNLTTYQSRLQAMITSLDIQGRGIDSPEYCDFSAVQNKNSSDDFKSFCKAYTAYLLSERTALTQRIATVNTM
jgi:hypothetical protein